VTFAQIESVRLIDAILSAPTQHTLFGLRRSMVSSIFSRAVRVATRFVTGVPGFSCLSVMCAGASPPNPQEEMPAHLLRLLMETSPTKIRRRHVERRPMLGVRGRAAHRGTAREGVLEDQRNRTRLADAIR